MARVLVLFALLAFLSGVFVGVRPRAPVQHAALPDSLGYADTISEGAGTN
jgi:hypothetical protein